MRSSLRPAASGISGCPRTSASISTATARRGCWGWRLAAKPRSKSRPTPPSGCSAATGCTASSKSWTMDRAVHHPVLRCRRPVGLDPVARGPGAGPRACRAGQAGHRRPALDRSSPLGQADRGRGSHTRALDGGRDRRPQPAASPAPFRPSGLRCSRRCSPTCSRSCGDEASARVPSAEVRDRFRLQRRRADRNTSIC